MNSVKLESGDTPGFMPELSEKEKIGLVQRIKNTLKTIGDCFMSLFRATEVDHNYNSYKNFMTSSADDTKFVIVGGTAVDNGGPKGNPLVDDAPPSYDVATQGQPDDTNWRERFSSKGTSGSFEERLKKEGAAVEAKGVICTDL